VKRSILLADDSPTIQRLVTQTFADANFDVVCVSNGEAAIKKFEEIHPMLVLADIYMPGKNGYEVCAYIKNLAGYSEVPVVLLVGAFDAFDDATASLAGAAAHIKKPFEPQGLLDLVAAMLPGDAQVSTGKSKEKEQDVEKSSDDTAVFTAVPAAAPDTAAAATVAMAPTVVLAESEVVQDDGADLLGLDDLFKPAVEETSQPVALSDAEVDRIADRVIQKLSTQVVEGVAWEVVPKIVDKVLQEELKKRS